MSKTDTARLFFSAVTKPAVWFSCPSFPSVNLQMIIVCSIWWECAVYLEGKALNLFQGYHWLSEEKTGCSAAWLARLTGGQEVGGSNPLSPTLHSILKSPLRDSVTIFLPYRIGVFSSGREKSFFGSEPMYTFKLICLCSLNCEKA